MEPGTLEWTNTPRRSLYLIEEDILTAVKTSMIGWINLDQSGSVIDPWGTDGQTAGSRSVSNDPCQNKEPFHQWKPTRLDRNESSSIVNLVKHRGCPGAIRFTLSAYYPWWGFLISRGLNSTSTEKICEPIRETRYTDGWHDGKESIHVPWSRYRIKSR